MFVIPNPPRWWVRNLDLDLVPYEPGPCTTEDTEDHREMQTSTVNGERSTVNGRAGEPRGVRRETEKRGLSFRTRLAGG